MKIRRALATAAATAALAGGLTAAPATADTNAAAVTCNGWGTHTDVDDWDEVRWDIPRAYIRSGPYAECSSEYTLGSAALVDISCYVVNDYGRKWTYVVYHTQGYIFHGWVYDVNLTYGGSRRAC
ncbi:SH3 domain-containing protein [Streptomyces hainanensis]|uniref:SH3 domain-containing protein n=1 Tax=Streptomyces hainanensis TaxID=402648 RepID=A0A4R4TNP9_9ACTN|nr:SH3 domain-containing protein [Streptomyces hainanensis]TDC76932.1 SH3 domain-containing protein [Streptomyces hainanensis]